MTSNTLYPSPSDRIFFSAVGRWGIYCPPPCWRCWPSARLGWHCRRWSRCSLRYCWSVRVRSDELHLRLLEERRSLGGSSGGFPLNCSLLLGETIQSSPGFRRDAACSIGEWRSLYFSICSLGRGWVAYLLCTTRATLVNARPTWFLGSGCYRRRPDLRPGVK